MSCASFLKYSGILLSLFGCVCIGFSLYTLNDRGEDFTEEDAYNTQHIFVLIVLIVGVLSFLAGIFGTCGSAKNITCMLVAYKIMTYFLFFIFLGLGITSVFLLYAVGKDIQEPEDCYDNTYTKNLGKLDDLSQDLFCTQACPCYIGLEDRDSFLQNIKSDAVFSDNEDDKKVTNCQKFEEQSELISGSTKFLKLLEKNFNCAGFCTKSEFFMYDDIRSDVEEEKSCARLIGEEIETNFFIYMIIFFAFALFMIFNICGTNCYKAKEKEREDKSKNYQTTDNYHN